MRSRVTLVLAAMGLLAVGAACQPSDPIDLEDWCPTAGGNSLSTCTALHPDDPALRLPTNPRIGVVTRGGEAFVTSAGPLPLSLGPDLIDAGISGSARAEYATTLYEATIVDDTVTAMIAVAAVDDAAVLTSVFGGRAMEGTIAELVELDRYSSAPTLAIRIEFADTASDGRLAGTIVNADRGVVGADGTCLPALSAAARNPLVGFYTPEIWLTRAPSMGAPFDDQLVLNWNEWTSAMGPGFYPSLATLAGADPLDPAWEVAPVGDPLLGPSLGLQLVDRGGGSC